MIALALPGIVDCAAVSTWSVHSAMHQPATEVELTRPADADSPRLAKALAEGSRSATATLLVGKVTPLGWIRDMTVTFSDCSISSFQTYGQYDSVWLRFAWMEIEQ